MTDKPAHPLPAQPGGPLARGHRNDLGIYDAAAADWWSDEVRWLRTLRNLVPGRLAWFDRHVDWGRFARPRLRGRLHGRRARGQGGAGDGHRPVGLFLYGTINRNLLSRFGVVTLAEDVLGLLPKGTHEPGLFMKPKELRRALMDAGLVAGQTKGLGPRGIYRRGDFVFGPVPVRSVIYMGVASKPAAFR